MDHSGHCAYIYEPVQHLPAGSSQAADPTSCGRNRQRDPQHKGQETRRDERALDHILPDLGKVEELVEPDVSQEMERAAEEREQAEHSAKSNQVWQVQKLP